MGANLSYPTSGLESEDDSSRFDSDDQDYYVLLGVSENATSNEIKIAYRSLALKHHLDKNTNDMDVASQRFTRIQRAYEVLGNNHTRVVYDDSKPTRMAKPTVPAKENTSAMPGNFKPPMPKPTPQSASNFPNSLKPQTHPAASNSRPQEETKTQARKSPFPPGYKPGTGPGGLSPKDIMFFSVVILFSMENETSLTTLECCKEVFMKITHDERVHGTELNILPSYGNEFSSSGTVNAFYMLWQVFETKKDFTWVDFSDLAAGASKRTRKRARAAARRALIDEYNESIRKLVSLAMKADIRMNDSDDSESSCGCPVCEVMQEMQANHARRTG